MSNSRLENIDFMRTIAIVIMIIANSSPYVLETPHSTGLRLISSLAAPLFIFLSGYSFVLSFKKKLDYKRKALQAFYLFVTAALIDTAVWRMLPFHTFDVLYLIAFGILFNLIIFRFNWMVKLSIAVAIIFLSFTLRIFLGYRFEPDDFKISSIIWTNFDPAFLLQGKRLLIDGWFPVLPWLSLSIIGSVVAEKADAFIRYKNIIKWISLLFFVLGLILILNQNISPEERDGYLELFYPPGIVYLLIAFSFILTLFSFTNSMSFPGKINIINLFGRHSLFVYLLHNVVISYIFGEYFKPLNGSLFSLLMLAFIIFCFIAALIVERFNSHVSLKFIPSGIRSILGLK
jgi:uncharacterized membrane protein